MKKFVSKIPFISTVAAVLSFNILVILIVLLLQKTLPPEVPLFFGKPLGEEQLTAKIFLVIPPALAVVVILFNTLLLKISKDHLLQKVILATTFLVTALSTTAVFQVIRLVGSLF